MASESKAENNFADITEAIKASGSKTYFPKERDLGYENKEWYIVDAAGKNLGRLASEVAKVLIGKNKASYTPHADCGDFVVVVNADKVSLTGKKLSQKSYFHHTGYIGGVVEKKASEILEKKPEDLIKKAVKGMMGSGPLARTRFKKLKVYAGESHPHQAQNPSVLDIKK